MRIRQSVIAHTSGDPTPGAPRWLSILIFLLIYGLFQWAYQSVRSSSWDGWFIHELTARPAAWLIGVFRPAEAVQALGYKLVWPGGALALRAGCDGFEVIGLFIAAMLTANVSWRRGTLALIGGCVAIWAMNQIRILALYGAVRYDREWFDTLHTGIGPLVLIVAVIGLYLWALRRPAAAASVAA